MIGLHQGKGYSLRERGSGIVPGLTQRVGCSRTRGLLRPPPDTPAIGLDALG